MKKVITAVFTAIFATAVYASCSTHTYFVNGKIVTCTTCCYGSNCNTTCF